MSGKRQPTHPGDRHDQHSKYRIRAIVLVHGGFVDGSGWEGVYSILKKDGYNVSIVQNPTISLADDVAATKRVIAAQDGPVILVGHSYGGVVITEAGNDPKVAALVYIAAFAPDKGESVRADQGPAAGRAGSADPAAAGRLPAPRPGEIRRRRSRPMSTPTRPSSWPIRRCPGASRRSAGAVSEPAWKTKPSWYLVATDDRMIPPAAQRHMAERPAPQSRSRGQPRDLRFAARGRRSAHPEPPSIRTSRPAVANTDRLQRGLSVFWAQRVTSSSSSCPNVSRIASAAPAPSASSASFEG